MSEPSPDLAALAESVREIEQHVAEAGFGAQHLLRPDQREHPHRTVPPGLGDVVLDLADGFGQRGQVGGGLTHRLSLIHI